MVTRNEPQSDGSSVSWLSVLAAGCCDGIPWWLTPVGPESKCSSRRMQLRFRQRFPYPMRHAGGE